MFISQVRVVTLNINLIRNDLRKSYTHLSAVRCKFLLAKRIGVFCWIHIHIYCLSWLIMIRLFTCVIKNTHGFLLFTTEVQGWIDQEAFYSELVANINPLKAVLNKFRTFKNMNLMSKLMVCNFFWLNFNKLTFHIFLSIKSLTKM